MESFLNHVVRWGDLLSSKIPFIPDFPFKGPILIVCGISIVFGIVGALRVLAATARVPDPAERIRRAEDLARKGQFEAAKEVFLQANVLTRAAQMALKLDQKDEAIRLSVAAGDFLSAAPVLVGLGKHLEAAALYERAGKHIEAGTQYERAGQLDKALEKYHASGSRRRVEELLRRLGRMSDVGDILASEFSEAHAALAVNAPHEQQQKVAMLASQACLAYRQAKNWPKSAEIAVRAGLPGEAAKALEEGKDYLRAADLYHQAGKLEESAKMFIAGGKYELAIDVYEELGRTDDIPSLFERAGRPQEAHLYAGRLALAQNDLPRAAGHFFEAGDYSQASQLFIEAGDFAKAAEAFEAASNLPLAAENYERANQYLKAAPLYARAGNHAKAGTCFEKEGRSDLALSHFEAAGRHFDAARLCESKGDMERAISNYQRVPDSDEQYSKALQRLGVIFWGKGLSDMATRMFRLYLKREKIGRETLDGFYDAALFFESVGNIEDAGKIFDAVLAVDFRYRDVYARQAALAQRTKAPPEPRRIVSTGPPQSGEVIAERYEVIRSIGSGAMGVIFVAKDRKLSRTVALKFVASNLQREEGNRLIREAKVVAQLSHSNIVGIYDLGWHRESVFTVMEFVDGPNLKQVLEEKGPFPFENVRNVGTQVADALAYAHSAHVIHRDIKSANLLLAAGRLVKIADFGLARILREGEIAKTQTLGSPLYMAPEQIRGAAFDHRADLYALGIVLYEILTGAPPFTEGEVTHHHLYTAPTPPTERRPDTPEDLNRLILRLLEKEADKRFQTAEEVRMVLETMVLG